MAIKTIKYAVDIAGIVPATEQFAGTQGDHRVTSLVFELSDYVYDAITEAVADGKAMYRFDIYDGEGGIWSSEAAELVDTTVSIELEERHTRYGGKITVYLVMTALSSDNETEIELYSFPSVLRLKNRPEGVCQGGENYESITGLVEAAKAMADDAALSASAAESSNQELQEFAAEIEEKLKNGDFDGLGVKNAEIINDELIITYTDNASQNLGNVKGDKGDTGPHGEKGDTGDTGAAGKDGSDGVGIASVYIEDGYLYVRKTNETTAQNLGRVKGDKGDTGNAVADGVVEAVADTIPLRDGKSALNVGLTFKDISNGLPVPMRMLDDGGNNIIYWDGTVATSFSSTAAGTKDDPIIISTAEELAYLVKNASKSMTVFSTEDSYGNTVYKPKYFKIADGIDAIVLQNETYANEIIALSSSNDVYDYFTDENKTFSEWVGTGWEQTMFGGHFDGNGAIIYGMYFNSGSAINNGLFSTIEAGASIVNTIIKNAYMKNTAGNYNTGAIAAVSSGDSYGIGIGGVIAVNNCAVINCYLRNSTTEYMRCGVLLGNLQDAAYVENCLVSGNDAAYGTDVAMPLVASVSTSVVSTALAPENLNAKLYYESNNGRYLHYNMIRNSIVLGTTPYNVVHYALRKNEPECFENVFTDAPSGTVAFSNSTSVTYTDEQIMQIAYEDIIGENATRVMPILAWGTEWFTPASYKGQSVPVDYLRYVQQMLNSKFGTLESADATETKERKSADSKLQSSLNAKMITSIYTSGKYTFDWNAMYLIKSNSGSVDIKLYNSTTGKVVVDGDGNNLPASSLCLLILPKSTTGVSGKLCMFVGMTGTFSIVNPNVLKGLQFTVTSGDVYFTPASSASIFKIAL